MADKLNLTKVSSANAKFPKGADRQTKYASKNVLSQVGAGPRRAPQYTLEAQKK